MKISIRFEYGKFVINEKIDNGNDYEIIYLVPYGIKAYIIGQYLEFAEKMEKPTNCREFEIINWNEIFEEECIIKWTDEGQIPVFSGMDIYMEKKTILNMEGIIELAGGNFMYNCYGKYKPDICFLLGKIPMMTSWKPMMPSDLNLERGDLSFLQGDYFISRKGTNCFKLSPQGNHLLIRDDWGGAFNKYRGGCLASLKNEYYRRASSNGGGSGYDYVIIDKNTKFVVSEDEI